MYPLRKFWNLSLVSNYNNRSVIDLFEVSEEMRMRMEKADLLFKHGISNYSGEKKNEGETEKNLKLPSIKNRRRNLKDDDDEVSSAIAPILAEHSKKQRETSLTRENVTLAKVNDKYVGRSIDPGEYMSVRISNEGSLPKRRFSTKPNLYSEKGKRNSLFSENMKESRMIKQPKRSLIYRGERIFDTEDENGNNELMVAE